MSEDERLREVVGAAARLQAEERDARAERVDAADVAQELGIEPRFVRRAEAELAARAAARRRALVVGAGAALMLVAAAAATRVVFLSTQRPPTPRATASTSASAPATTAAPAPDVAGRVVLIDRGASDGPKSGEDALARAGAKVTSRDAALDAASLAGVDVVMLVHPRRRGLAPGEVDALVSFVERGGGLVVAELGWSWVYLKRPLSELPANVLGARLGFSFGDAPADPSVSPLDPRAPPVARTSGWVPGVVSAPRGEVVLRDARGATVGALVRAGDGAVFVVGHHGILDDSPAWVVRAAALTARRR